MNRVAAPSFVGAKGFDTVATIDASHARALAKEGMNFAIRYLGALTSEEVDDLLAAGLAVMGVTYGNQPDGHATVSGAIKAGLPSGVTLWRDIEGRPSGTERELISSINAWARIVSASGYEPGIYVGASALLTSDELYRLEVTRYWHSLSKVLDRNGALAEPTCGWCAYQLFPSVTVAGVFVDVNFIQEDYRGRLPTWCTLAEPVPDTDPSGAGFVVSPESSGQIKAYRGT